MFNSKKPPINVITHKLELRQTKIINSINKFIDKLVGFINNKTTNFELAKFINSYTYIDMLYFTSSTKGPYSFRTFMKQNLKWKPSDKKIMKLIEQNDDNYVYIENREYALGQNNYQNFVNYILKNGPVDNICMNINVLIEQELRTDNKELFLDRCKNVSPEKKFCEECTKLHSTQYPNCYVTIYNR